MIKAVELLFIEICTLLINLELGSGECDMISAPQRLAIFLSIDNASLTVTDISKKSRVELSVVPISVFRQASAHLIKMDGALDVLLQNAKLFGCTL